MKILGIETSCDETAAAVVEDGVKIRSDVIASSQDMHAKTGGIIPEQAARQQVKSIIPVIKQALEDAALDKNQIDAIAITVGPGLIGSLLVGVETAKTLSFVWNKPIIPVNHLVGHIYANFIREKPNSKNQIPNFPALGLVVSGGHTDLVLMQGHGSIDWIGGTRDDAAGEAFDKSARLLGLKYPGGPSISKAADEYFSSTSLPLRGKTALTLFPRPLLGEKSFDFSFSGLKTAVLRETQNKKISVSQRNIYAAEVQEAIVDVLVEKSARAIEKYQPKSFLLAGGVAANTRLREKFAEKLLNLNVSFFVPAPALCTDNAAYIASAACFNYKPVEWKGVSAQPELQITSDLA